MRIHKKYEFVTFICDKCGEKREYITELVKEGFDYYESQKNPIPSLPKGWMEVNTKLWGRTLYCNKHAIV